MPGCVRLAVSLLAVSPLYLCGVAKAVPETDLSARIAVDGLTADWDSDESAFGTNPVSGAPEEGTSDSEWGTQNDVRQIRISWDAEFLYVAVDATIWDNNVILLIDHAPGGMTEMTNLNSWRRNFVFRNLQPDLFLATWDRNTLPQAWTSVGTNQVTQRDATSFATVATFDQGTPGRAMEAALPWPFLLGDDAVRDFSAAVGESLWVVPAERSVLRVVAIVTAGGDGTGGPDSAPDNLSGHSAESSDQVTIDNYAEIPLDLDGDGFCDFGQSVKERVSFLVQPPVRGVRMEIADVAFARSVISPENGGELAFRVRLSPEVPSGESFRTVVLSAEVFDRRGKRVKELYRNHERSAADPVSLAMDRWDGRDWDGGIVPGGIYVLRVVIEPETHRFTRAFSVVR
ncbi:MAG: hypothetical protein QF819_00240 [Gemmatimonadota bacterium]|nr:hypothetical protein [Gemmatimonadota bacterium]MDP6460413.1 hypothetical protein [Gemmatimonadota bacterium]MDP6801592.1 hypothetical protein [Gemmatimonadota bacterium]